MASTPHTPQKIGPEMPRPLCPPPLEKRRTCGYFVGGMCVSGSDPQDGQAGHLGLETGCEVSRRSCINPDASRFCPRTGTGAGVVGGASGEAIAKHTLKIRYFDVWASV